MSTLCDPRGGSPPGSSVRGVLQARTLLLVAISFSRGSSRSRDHTPVSYFSCIAGRFCLSHLGSPVPGLDNCWCTFCLWSTCLLWVFHIRLASLSIMFLLLNSIYCKDIHIIFSSVHAFSSVAQLCLTLWDPMDCSMPGFSVLYYLPESAQTHIHLIGDAIQPSHVLLPPSFPAINLSLHQSLFQWVRFLNQVVRGLEFQLQHQSFQWIFRFDFL